MKKELKDNLWRAFKNLKKQALYLSHYDLYEETKLASPTEWKDFLLSPDVIEYIREEMDIIRKSAINEILIDAGDSNSVGKAQLLNSITKFDESNSGKEGPVFIYTYVPLNEEQAKAPNVNYTEKDIFLKPAKSIFGDK